MCGLVGVAGDLAFKDEGLMKRLLLFDYLRGADSTGFAYLRDNGDAGIAKVASHPIDLFDMEKFKKGLSGYTSSIFLGHNRAATLGKVNGANAHPFQYGDIFGAHNGTLLTEDWHLLDKEAGETTDVDSAGLYNAINELGIKNTIEMIHEGTTSQRGAWALTYFDAYEKKLYFLKNKHRPLWYSYTDDLTRIIWASEHWMIQAAVEGGDYKLYEDKDGCCYFPVEDNVLYEIPMSDLIKKGKKGPTDYRTIEIKGKPQRSVASAGSAPFQGNHQLSKTTSNSSMVTMGTTDSGKTPPWTDIVGTDMRPYGGYLDETDHNEIASGGCSWCGEKLPYGTKNVTVWERTDTIMCGGCTGKSDGNITIHADPVAYLTLQTRVADARKKRAA